MNLATPRESLTAYFGAACWSYPTYIHFSVSTIIECDLFDKKSILCIHVLLEQVNMNIFSTLHSLCIVNSYSVNGNNVIRSGSSPAAVHIPISDHTTYTATKAWTERCLLDNGALKQKHSP